MREREPENTFSDMDFILWLYQEFKPLMFATAQKYLEHLPDQEDIVQTSLVKLMEKVTILQDKERGALCSYVVYTVKNTALNYLKHQNVINAHSYSLDDSFLEIPSDSLPLDELVQLIDRKRQLSGIWNRLPEEDRVLLESKYILGRSNQQLSGEFHCKATSIRMKLTRARRKALQFIMNDEVKNHDRP